MVKICTQYHYNILHIFKITADIHISVQCTHCIPLAGISQVEIYFHLQSIFGQCTENFFMIEIYHNTMYMR